MDREREKIDIVGAEGKKGSEWGKGAVAPSTGSFRECVSFTSFTPRSLPSLVIFRMPGFS